MNKRRKARWRRKQQLYSELAKSLLANYTPPEKDWWLVSVWDGGCWLPYPSTAI